MYALNFRKKILYGVRKKATHHHTDQLRLCTFFPDLVRIGPPPPPAGLEGLGRPPALHGPVLGARFRARLQGPLPRPVTHPRFSPTAAAGRPPPPPGARAGLCEPYGARRAPAGRPVVALRPVESGPRYPRARPRYPKARPRYPKADPSHPKAARPVPFRTPPASPGRPTTPTASRGPFLPSAARPGGSEREAGETPASDHLGRRTAKRTRRRRCGIPPNPGPSGPLSLGRPNPPTKPFATPSARPPRPGGPRARAPPPLRDRAAAQATRKLAWPRVPESRPGPAGPKADPRPPCPTLSTPAATAPRETAPALKGGRHRAASPFLGWVTRKPAAAPLPRRPSYRPWAPAWVPTPARRALVYGSGFRKTPGYGAWEKTSSRSRPPAQAAARGLQRAPCASQARLPESASGRGYPRPCSAPPSTPLAWRARGRPASRVTRKPGPSLADAAPRARSTKSEAGYPEARAPQPKPAQPKPAQPEPAQPSRSQVTRKPSGPRRTTNKSHHSSY